MNYRHAYHAGNFADVFKHAVLARILVHLAKKDAAFRVIDSHAGRGLYQLDGRQALQTGEWEGGIGRILKTTLTPDVQSLLEPWLDVVKRFTDQQLYPGSPILIDSLTRFQDRLVFCEKHPEEAEELERQFATSRLVTVKQTDGWAALAALLPPPERRGLVLIDPPFEEEREFKTILNSLRSSLRRWERGVYAVWYPIKGRREVERFIGQIQRMGAKTLRAEIILYRVERIDRLNGCGMVIINPPWHLDEDINLFAPSLVDALGRESGARHLVEWLVPE